MGRALIVGREPIALGPCSHRHSLRILRNATCFHELLLVFWRQLRTVERERHLVNLAGKWERYLVVSVVDGSGSTGADVKRLLEGQAKGNATLHPFCGDHLPVHLERSRTAATNAAHVVECQGGSAEAVIFEVVHNRMLAGSKRFRPLPARPLEIKE